MKVIYKPKNKLEKFGEKVYSALVENFSQTFFVGGIVRDLLLSRKIADIDIATAATPDEIINALKNHGIVYSDTHKKFGNVVAKQGKLEVEITTFRKDLGAQSRYGKMRFIKSAKQDSKRRDFTINSLYLRLKGNSIADFNKGSADIKAGIIRFIGKPKKRILADPLRIIRALRFALILNFKLENKTQIAIKNNFNLIGSLTKTKLQKEINKISNATQRKILEEVINKPESLDKYFK